MAELSVGTMNVTIQADGSAAIAEIERVGQAADGMAGAVEGAAGSARNAGGEMARAFEGAGDAAGAAGEAGAAAGGRIEQGAQRAARSVKEVGEVLSKAGEQAAKFVTLPIVGAMTASVKGASDLVETVGKTEVVFDSLSDKVMAWSENSVQAMGLAQGSALEYASTFGDMGKGMGLALDQATQMSMNLTQLAADLASFKNIRTDVAAQKLNAVYTGETEGLKSLGIVMTQTNLQAFALSQGIAKQVSAMSQAELVSLRYQYVMNATKDAQGDFARTGDSLANQTRKLTETIKQAGESFGSQLIPMITPVVEKIQQWVQHIAELDSGTKNLVLGIALTAAAIGPLLLVGGKLLTFLATLKASLAALTINPVVLAIGAVAAAGAAIAGITRALNRANGDIDDSSAAFKRMKAAVEKGAEGKVTVDDSELAELPEEKTIAITAVGRDALDDAQRICDELNSGAYDGQLAIDGDPKKAEDALDKIEADIRAARESVTIDGDGNAVIGDGGLLDTIQADIAALETVVVITDDPVARAELEARISSLKNRLNALVGDVRFNVPAGDQAKLAAFRRELEKLPKDERFQGYGKFTYDEGERKNLADFNQAMMDAAGVVGDFESAVDKMNQAVDAELQESIKQVLDQATEQAQLLTAAHELGTLTDEQYLAEMQKIIDAKDAEITRLRQAAEAKKEGNKTLADGDAGNDTQFVADTMTEQYRSGQGVQVTPELTNQSLALIDQAADRSAMTGEGATALVGMVQQAQAQYEGLTAAVETYNQAQADAAAQDAMADSLTEQAGMYDRVGEAIDRYSTAVGVGLDAQDAFNLAMEVLGENADPSMIEALNAALIDEQGNLVDAATALDALTAAQQAQNDSTAQAAEAQAQADQARADAAQALQDSLGELKDTAMSGEAVEGAILTIGETGVDITGAQQALLTGMPAAVEEAYAAAEAAVQSGTDPAQAIAEAVQNSAGLVEAATTGAVEGAAGKARGEAEGEGRPIGSNLIEGAASGVRSRAAQLAQEARRVVRDAINAAKAEAQIASPSRVMKNEVGAMLMRGAAEGIEAETPKTVSVMRRSAQRLISGAAAVAGGGAVAQAVPAAAGMDYEAMGAAMETAMSRVRFGFSVSERELAQATREENARQLAVQSRRVAGRYGG